MKPLSSVAMGLVIIVLVAPLGGVDALADPVGWLLVVWGVRRLPDPTRVMTLAVAALVVASTVWWPEMQEVLDRADPSLRWAVNLPQVAFCVALCHRLAGLAAAAGDVKAAAWQRTAKVLNAALAAAPVLAFASGSEGALTAIYAGAAAVLILLIVVLFAHAGRPWAPQAPVVQHS